MDFRNETMYYPLGIRSNNPLNISGTGWQGQVGTANNPQKEAIFIDTQHGLRAAAILLYNYYKKYDLTTIRGIIRRWAPADDPDANNQPDSYANYVGRETGIDPDKPFDLNGTNIKAIMLAMVQMEQGSKYADIIPDSDYDEGIKMANRTELLIQAGKIGGFILLLVFGFLFIKKME
jgi:hypothetical protein